MTTPDNILKRPPTAWQLLKQRSLSVERIRQVDRLAIEKFHMNSLVLMENAAIGCAQWLTNKFSPEVEATILCGRGNNGGDGLAIARHLRVAGWKCRVIQCGPIDKLSPDARSNWEILTAKKMNGITVVGETVIADQLTEIQKQLNRSDVIVDALLGSGAQGAPRAPFSNLIAMANAASGMRVAIDIPSGLDATTGQPATPTFAAQATLTFVARKIGFAAPAAQTCLGQVEVIPIGIPLELIEELLTVED